MKNSFCEDYLEPLTKLSVENRNVTHVLKIIKYFIPSIAFNLKPNIRFAIRKFSAHMTAQIPVHKQSRYGTINTIFNVIARCSYNILRHIALDTKTNASEYSMNPPSKLQFWVCLIFTFRKVKLIHLFLNLQF